MRRRCGAGVRPSPEGLTRRAVLGAALAAPLPLAPVKVFDADAFVDSVGVNVHLGSDPYLGAFDTVRDQLGALGVRYVRDELRPDNDLGRWRTLHRLHGIRSHLLVSPVTNTVAEMLHYLDAVGPQTVSAIEGQNEGDSDWFMAQKQARPRWDQAVIAYQRAVFRAVRARYPALPVLSPSVIDYKPVDARLLRPAAPFSDLVALHPYAQRAQAPETTDEYAGLDWYLRMMRDGFRPGAPAMATEAGYTTLDRPGGISEAAQATYLPRLLLHFFAAGIRRTFLYEFMDGGADPADSEHHFGLLRHDGSPKPAFTAVAGLLQALATPQPRPSQRMAQPVIYMDGSARCVGFSKPEGEVILAIWRAVPVWDAERRKNVAVPTTPVALRLNAPPRRADWRPLSEAHWRSLPMTPDLTFDVGASVALVRIAV